MFLFLAHIVCHLNYKTLVVSLYIACNYSDVNLFSPEMRIGPHVYRLSVSHVIVGVCQEHFVSNRTKYIFMSLMENVIK